MLRRIYSFMFWVWLGSAAYFTGTASYGKAALCIMLAGLNRQLAHEYFKKQVLKQLLRKLGISPSEKGDV